jgi:hypothetical protein
MNFKYTWQDYRVPKTVTLPDGNIETVQYMRDGICLFVSHRSATYERIGDHEAEFTMIESFGQAKEAVANYRAAQHSVEPTVSRVGACPVAGDDCNDPTCPYCN